MPATLPSALLATAQDATGAITRHALLGYVFGAVIIGVTINVVGGLIQ